MLTLIAILLILLVSLTVILWAGTFFFQGYIYTEPSAGIFWQAPLAAFVLTIGYAIWMFSVAFSSEASPTNIPINVLFKFSPYEDMFDRPARKVWAIRLDRRKDGADKDGIRVLYTSYTGHDGARQIFQYKDAQGRNWQGQDVIALEIEKDEQTKIRFDFVPNDVGDYREFRSPEGWTVRDYFKDGLTGTPSRFRVTRLVLNLVFNIAHYVAWFLVLWLALRFQWSHALGLALILWLVVTLTFLPMILGTAAEYAQGRQVRTAAASLPNLASR